LECLNILNIETFFRLDSYINSKILVNLMNKILSKLILLLLLNVLFQETSSAQLFSTRSVSGVLTLESGAATEDIQITVTVSAYSIVRQFRSSRSTAVTIRAGQSSANYSVTGISDSGFDPVYSVRFFCSNCPNVVEQQYYSPVRQVYALENASYLDDDELPSQLNYLVRAGTSISGELSLRSKEVAEEDLIFVVFAVIGTAPGNSAVIRAFVIPKGNSSVSYRLDGIIPEVGHSSFVAYSCLNCDGSSEIAGQAPNSLTTQINHININFSISLGGASFIPAILDLLLLN
jgi:hypothetical protein